MKSVLAGLFGLLLAMTLAPSTALAVEDAAPSARAAPLVNLVEVEGDIVEDATPIGLVGTTEETAVEGDGPDTQVDVQVIEDGIDTQASAQIVDEGGTSEAVSEDGTTIEVGKTIEATGTENYFDITLTVEVSEEPGDNSTAVVLVMDVSNTMNDVTTEGSSAGSTRLASAQAAANAFVQQYCEGEGLSESRMLGVVVFNTNAQWADGLELQAVTSSSTSALQTSISAITAPSTPSEVRFTNMEAGLRLAYNALSDLQVAHKYLIFLTDGFPTTYIDRSIEGNFENDVSIAGYNPYQQGAYAPANVGEDGYFADAVLGLPCSYGTSYSDKAAQRAADAAAVLKDGDESSGQVGVNVFSVGIDIGGQTIDYYVSRATGTFSIVDRMSESYVIGDASDASSYRDWLTTVIAGGPSLTEESHRYASGDSAEELQAAFADILSDIRVTSSMPLREAVVVDPMGSDIEFLYFFDADDNPADELTGSYGESTEENPLGNTAAFDSGSRSITWDLMQSGYLESVEESGVRTYSYVLKYRIRLMNEVPVFAFEMAVPTNDGAELRYKTLDHDGILVSNDPISFPDPAVKGYEGKLDLAKVNAETDEPVPGAVFELIHSEDCAACAAQSQVSIEPQQQISDKQGRARFAGIPSGHDYVLVELEPAEGYLPHEGQFVVQVSYGQTAIGDADGQVIPLDGSSLRVENEPIEAPPVDPDPDTPGNPDVPVLPVTPSGDEPTSVTPSVIAQTGDYTLGGALVIAVMAFAALSVVVLVARRG